MGRHKQGGIRDDRARKKEAAVGKPLYIFYMFL